jgi:hypothetical protein
MTQCNFQFAFPFFKKTDQVGVRPCSADALSLKPSQPPSIPLRQLNCDFSTHVARHLIEGSKNWAREASDNRSRSDSNSRWYGTGCIDTIWA